MRENNDAGEPELPFDSTSGASVPDAPAGPVLGLENADAVYKGVDFAGLDLTDLSFDSCRFEGCRFNGVLFTGTAFRDCAFKNCEFTLTRFPGTILNGAHFSGCKLMGVNLTDCADFGLSPDFEDCLVDGLVVYGKSLRKIRAIGCRFADSDFTEVDFRDADFSRSVFERCVFQRSNLEKADFRSARGYEIDPAANKLRGGRYAMPEAQSFLSFLGIKID